jgi:LysM repeat protein
MGIIDTGIGKGLSAIGLSGVTNRSVKPPKGFGPDFPEGLRIIEIIDGRERPLDAITLLGSFMPLIPFEYGGTQQIVKDYYPGNSEPVVQVLGPRENDTTIRGKFKTKRFPDDVGLQFAAREYQELVDAMRLRGNMVKITLGEWRRYGFIEECAFKLNRLSDIEYSIKFSIIGFNPPRNCKFVANPDDDLIAPNKRLTRTAEALLGQMQNYPSTMPRTISEFLNDQISSVASVVNLVTGFVDGALADVENLTASANRAVGLIKNARATISRTGRRIGALQMNISTLGTGVSRRSFKSAAVITNAAHIHKILGGMSTLAALLAALQARYATLTKTVPMKRHLVKQGDTLQRLAMKYYNSSDSWKVIYDHNKLSSTNLVVGSVLEIPKV